MPFFLIFTLASASQLSPAQDHLSRIGNIDLKTIYSDSCLGPGSSWSYERPNLFRRSDIVPENGVSLFLEHEKIMKLRLDSSGVNGYRTDGNNAITGRLASGTTANDVDLQVNALWLRGAYGVLSLPDNLFAIEIFALVGFTDISLDGNVRKPGMSADDLAIESQGAFGYGIGSKIQFYKHKKLGIFSEISFKRSANAVDIDSVSSLDLNVPAGQTATQNFRSEIDSVTISGYASYRVTAGTLFISPYLGAHLSSSKINIYGSQSFVWPTFTGRQHINYKTRNDTLTGLMMGTDVVLAHNVGGFFELHFLDEKAIMLGAALSF